MESHSQLTDFYLLFCYVVAAAKDADYKQDKVPLS